MGDVCLKYRCRQSQICVRAATVGLQPTVLTSNTSINDMAQITNNAERNLFF